MTIEENGHIWKAGSGDERCINCQMKVSYYITIRFNSKAQPKRQDLKDWLKCKKGA